MNDPVTLRSIYRIKCVCESGLFGQALAESIQARTSWTTSVAVAPIDIAQRELVRADPDCRLLLCIVPAQRPLAEITAYVGHLRATHPLASIVIGLEQPRAYVISTLRQTGFALSAFSVRHAAADEVIDILSDAFSRRIRICGHCRSLVERHGEFIRQIRALPSTYPVLERFVLFGESPEAVARKTHMSRAWVYRLLRDTQRWAGLASLDDLASYCREQGLP